MKLTSSLALAAFPLLVAANAFAADSAFSLKVDAIGSAQPIPAEYAVCLPTSDAKSVPTGKNKRPTLSWSGAPKGTESFALVVVDPDVPADFSQANKDGVILPADAPRKNFYHFGRLDIPGNVVRIAGDSAIGVGQPASNDMKGYVKDTNDYGGPCPPWNDARLHSYHFVLYALDIKSLGMTTGVTAKTLAEKLENNPHVLAKTEVVGTYTLYTAVRP